MSFLSRYMDGFTSIFEWRKDSKPLCINLLFKTWTLDSSLKFTAAALGTVALALATEALGAFRRKLHAKRVGGNQQWFEAAASALHALQVALGYFLM